jgi:type II secretory pathway component GspD/PulD (secretin)
MNRTTGCSRLLAAAAVFVLTWLPVIPSEAQPVTLNLRNVEIAEVMQMLSRQNRVNILLSDGVDSRVSLNLYDVELDEAIRAIAAAGGFLVDVRNGSYFLFTPEDANQSPDASFTIVRTFPVQYADPLAMEETLRPYLSSFGKLAVLTEHRMLMLEDQPAYVERAEKLIRELDRHPRQILIEAKIMEVTLTDEESHGVDWSRLFSSDGGNGSFGTRGLSGPGNSGSSGFFFDYMTPDYEVALSALESTGRIRSLASPTLLALENQEASVIIGDRRGYRVTTTINQVTSESIEFLESGVILRVTPVIDEKRRILLDVHPEVSTGNVDANGIPSQTTTEVTTQLLVPSGQSIFIGGLIRNSSAEDRQGVPVLGRLPGVGKLFSNKEVSNINTETVVLITPRLVGESDMDALNESRAGRIPATETALEENVEVIRNDAAEFFGATFVPVED